MLHDQSFPFLRDLDPSKPDGRTSDGKPFWELRCKIPFSAPTPGYAEPVPVERRKGLLTRDAIGAQAAEAERVIIDPGQGEKVQPDATGNPGNDDEVNFEDVPMVQGVASSSSIDFFGTEMSLRALKGMAAQMMAGSGMNVGIPYVPAHNNSAGGPQEWFDVIGRTVHAEVVPVDEVRKAYNPAEQQFILRATVRLFPEEELAKKLCARIARGENIGQSIGGWFTQLQVVQNEEGGVERVIVLGVELDHLAATRAPANPDSHSLVGLRSAIETRFKSIARDAAAIGVESARGAVAFGNLPTAPEDETWTWGPAEQNAVLGDENWDRYKAAHAWVNPEQAQSKQGYKLPIAKMLANKLTVVWHGVAAAMSALNGGRGGVDIPDADREPVYNLLTRYYKKFGKEPPPLARSANLRVKRDKIDQTRLNDALQKRHIVSITDDGDYFLIAVAKQTELDETLAMLGVCPECGNVGDDCTCPDEETGETEPTVDVVVESSNRSTAASHVDTSNPAGHHTGGSGQTDARGSAPAEPTNPSPVIPTEDTHSEEHAMPTGNELTLDALRDLLSKELEPVKTRLAALEGDPATRARPSNPEPAPKGLATDPAIEQRLAAAEERARLAEERARHADDRVVAMLSSPARVGISGAPAVPAGRAAIGGYRGLCEIARSKGGVPTLVAVCERATAIVAEENGPKAVSTRDLTDLLGQLFNAAEADGLITNPSLRAQWK